MAVTPATAFRRWTRRAAVAVAFAVALASLTAAVVLAAPDHFLVSPSMPAGGWAAGSTWGATVYVRSTSTGLPDSAYRGTVQLTSTDPHFLRPADHTFTAADAGIWHFDLSFRTAGSQTLTATDVTEPGINGTSDPVRVVAGAPSALAFVQQPGNGTPGGALVRQPIVGVQDDWGNLVTSAPSAAVSLALNYPWSGGVGTLTCRGGTSATMSGGVATFSGCAVDLAGPEIYLVATAPSQPTWSSAMSTAFAVAAAAATTTHFVFTSVPTIVAAGTPFSVTFQATTAAGTVDAAYRGTVQFTSTDGLATSPVPYAFTAADAGARTVSWTLATAGAQTIAVTQIGGISIAGTASVTVSPTVRAATHLVFTSVPATATAGTAVRVVLSAVAADGLTVPAYRGTVRFSSTDPAATRPADYTFVAADTGVHAFTVTFAAGGTQTLTATDAAIASVTGTTSGIAVAAAPPVTTHFTFTGVPATVAAGTGTRFLMRATDAGGLTDPTYRGTVHFASTDSLATRPGDITFGAADAGSHLVAVTFATGGTQTVTAADSAYASITGTTPGIVVTGGASPSPSPSASPSASPSPSPTPTPAGALALVASSATTTYPAHVSLTVALAGGGSGRHVSIEGRPAGSTAWTEVGSVTTDATGTASLTLAPAHTSAYRAVWAGTPTLAAATSGPVAVAVRFFVAVSPSTTTRTAARGTRLGWTATVGPVTPGAIVRFRVYERTSTTWTLRGTTLVRTSATGKAAFSRTFASAGRFYMEAIALAGSQNASGGAPKKYITVR